MFVRFKHDELKFNQCAPHQAVTCIFRSNTGKVLREYETPKLIEGRKKVVQQVIGACLYYARAIDFTILPAVSSISNKLAKSTEKTEEKSSNY